MGILTGLDGSFLLLVGLLVAACLVWLAPPPPPTSPSRHVRDAYTRKSPLEEEMDHHA